MQPETTAADTLTMPEQTALSVELVMDSVRVTGQIITPGGPRRLVDIFNSTDAPFVLVHAAQIDDPLADDSEPQPYPVVQIHMPTILFAIPHGCDKQRDPMELVHKEPVLSTIALPGYHIRGNVHLIPGFEASSSAFVGDRHFIPMTDVEIVTTNRVRTWTEDIVVVNLAHVILFAPHPR